MIKRGLRLLFKRAKGKEMKNLFARCFNRILISKLLLQLPCRALYIQYQEMPSFGCSWYISRLFPAIYQWSAYITMV